MACVTIGHPLVAVYFIIIFCVNDNQEKLLSYAFNLLTL